MTVNMVSETSWILGRCARELKDRLGWTINSPNNANIDYHLPYWRGLNPERKPDIRVGFFTHDFTRATQLVIGGLFHAAVCMNLRMAQHVQSNLQHVRVIRPGVDTPLTYKRPVFGVVGRTYRDGRKGQHRIEEAMASGHEFLSLGPGPWPCPSAGTNLNGNAASNFWNAIDYLVVTGTAEGGPIPVLEAIAHNVPVIAPGVGWCWEFPVIRYSDSDADYPPFQDVLHGLSTLPTWERWAESHQRFFTELLQREV